MHRALPIHPLLAVLFMRGVPIRDALALVDQIVQAVPDNLRPVLYPCLTGFELPVPPRRSRTPSLGFTRNNDVFDTMATELHHRTRPAMPTTMLLVERTKTLSMSWLWPWTD